MNRLDAETDRARRTARRNGSGEPREAHAADAFVELCAGVGKRTARADIVYVCDLAAAARGHTHGDEPCHVIGGGPVPVSVVRAAAVDAFVKVAVRDGKQLHTIVHYGRKIPAELRTALELGDPERLDGAVCTEEGCDRRYGLELDHDDPVANGGPSSYGNMRWKCSPHHWDKTERDRKAGRLGPAGRPRTSVRSARGRRRSGAVRWCTIAAPSRRAVTATAVDAGEGDFRATGRRGRRGRTTTRRGGRRR